jgi:hypothetical protein
MSRAFLSACQTRMRREHRSRCPINSGDYAPPEIGICARDEARILRSARQSLRQLATALITATLLLVAPAASQAFSVLAHQAVVDQAWDNSLLPVVRKRFPKRD